MYDRGNTSFYCKPVNRVGEWFGEREIVLDLRHVNTFVDKQSVKFQGVKEAMVFTNYSKYVIQFDLKSGYHHLEIHPEHQKSVR